VRGLGADVRAVVHDVVEQRVAVGALHVLGGGAALRVPVRAPEVGPAKARNRSKAPHVSASLALRRRFLDWCSRMGVTYAAVTCAADLGYMAPRMSFCPYLRQLSPSSRGAMSCTAATRTCALTHGVPFLRQQTERASEHMSGRRTLLLDATNDETKA
jgi:hypothetical protein